MSFWRSVSLGNNTDWTFVMCGIARKTTQKKEKNKMVSFIDPSWLGSDPKRNPNINKEYDVVKQGMAWYKKQNDMVRRMMEYEGSEDQKYDKKRHAFRKTLNPNLSVEERDKLIEEWDTDNPMPIMYSSKF